MPSDMSPNLQPSHGSLSELEVPKGEKGRAGILGRIKKILEALSPYNCGNCEYVTFSCVPLGGTCIISSDFFMHFDWPLCAECKKIDFCTAQEVVRDPKTGEEKAGACYWVDPGDIVSIPRSDSSKMAEERSSTKNAGPVSGPDM